MRKDAEGWLHRGPVCRMGIRKSKRAESRVNLRVMIAVIVCDADGVVNM